MIQEHLNGARPPRTCWAILAEWEKTEAKGSLGFTPADLGGVILRSLGALEIDLTTRLAYDNLGRGRTDGNPEARSPYRPKH